MNPATPGPLTILLSPGADQRILDRGHAGAMPPIARRGGTRWVIGYAHNPTDGCDDIALVLWLDGAPAFEGIDRAARVARFGAPASDSDVAVVLAWARMLPIPGARVVLLRDGREVPNV